jgi:hypothetical protein
MIEVKFKKKSIVVESDDSRIRLNNLYEESLVIMFKDGRELYIDPTGKLDFYDKEGDPVDSW